MLLNGSIIRQSLARIRHKKFLIVIFVTLVLGSLSLNYRAVVAEGQCSGHVQSRYSATVCFVTPLDNDSVRGVVSVKVSVSILGRSPGVQKLIFNLDDEYLITDYAAPYEFKLPSARFVDGPRRLSVRAEMRDDFVTDPPSSIILNFNNGVTTLPVNTRQFKPYVPQITSGRPLIVAAVGDGASGETPEVADLIALWNPDMFLYLGDVYEKGTYTEFYNWYGVAGAFFSKFQRITNPIIGNHEYEPGVTPAYYDYWNNVPDFYSFDAGGWHFISLNSTSQFNQRRPGTRQYNWLQQDRAVRRGLCTLVYWHHPRFSIGPQDDTPAMDDIWRLLALTGVEVALTGNDHNYQRWVSLDANGNPHAEGITQFVAGMGGHGIRNFVREDERVASGYDTPSEAFGALRLEMYPDSLDYQYVNIEGKVLDSGEIVCHGSPP